MFLSTLPRNIIACFKGRMILWHLIAIGLTLVFVISGSDWFCFTSTRNPVLWSWLFPAAPSGMFLPVVLPCVLLAISGLGRSASLRVAAWAIGQAEIIGALITAAYEAFTGRVHPPHGDGADLSHVFQFGFLRGGVFWGWPSSHTTVAFAMAVTVFMLYAKQRWLGYLALTYALYIGVGVSMTIHWFSDFLAGAIIGTVVGTVVGKSFLQINTRIETRS